MSERDEFEAWWAGKYGEVLEITGDPEADATCRIAKIAAHDAWQAARATPKQAVPALTYADGIEAAARWVDKRREDFDAEFGAMDPDTGAFEFRSVTQEEYSWELVEVADGIRELLAAAPQPMRPDEPDRVGLCGYMDCDDEGMIDSGGVTPWGEWIRVPCPICNGAQS